MVEQLREVGIVKCSSSKEAEVWLRQFEMRVTSRLCVVTNRFREQDGGDLAWQRAVEVVRGVGLSKLRVVVLCGVPEKVELGKWKNVTVTNDAAVLLKHLKELHK